MRKSHAGVYRVKHRSRASAKG